MAPRYSQGGWNAKPRPVQATTPAPVARPTPGAIGPKAELTDDDKKKMLLVLWDMIQKDPNMKGQKGDPGEFDFAKMPPFVIKFVDKDRQSVEERPFVFSRERNRFEVEFDPIHVQNFDATAKPDSKPIDEEKYPYPGPIKLRHGAKVPAKTGPTT